ncbi:MAG: DUF177 domain-containing protein [Alicyclobacillaceae bacterium]|nr:DUF177 domain-containing protein [Alicyclobacillaceae bacterium]
MKLFLQDLRGRPEGVEVRERVALEDVTRRDRSLAALEPVDVEVRAHEVSGVYHVRGTLRTRAAYRCSRCLNEFWEPLETTFEERFVRGAKRSPEDQAEEEPSPVEGDEVDLRPYVEQAVLLALPWRPLCDPECAGLCPECGANLNEGPCGCSSQAIDPRWEKLGDVWKRMSGSSGGSG